MATRERRSQNLDWVAGLPAAGEADIEALRRARSIRLGARRIARLQAALPAASYEQLARRSLSVGEPFSLCSER